MRTLGPQTPQMGPPTAGYAGGQPAPQSYLPPGACGSGIRGPASAPPAYGQPQPQFAPQTSYASGNGGGCAGQSNFANASWPQVAMPQAAGMNNASPQSPSFSPSQLPKLQLPMSAQRLQDLQRSQAEQERSAQQQAAEAERQLAERQQREAAERRLAARQAEVERNFPQPTKGEAQWAPAPGGTAGEDRYANGCYSGGTQRAPHPGASEFDELLEEMRRNILSGNLRVYVYNSNLELQAKRLALNPTNRRISILRDVDGLCEDSWEMEHLCLITRGIDASILPVDPPPAAGGSFRFRFAEPGQEDRFLCVVFESMDQCILATEAFGQLCEVEVTVAS